MLAPTNLCETLPPPALFLPTAHVLAVINDCHHLYSLYIHPWVNIFCGWCTSCHHMPTSRRLGLPTRASEFVPNPLRFTPLPKHLIIPACSHFAFTYCHIPVVHPCTFFFYATITTSNHFSLLHPSFCFCIASTTLNVHGLLAPPPNGGGGAPLIELVYVYICTLRRLLSVLYQSNVFYNVIIFSIRFQGILACHHGNWPGHALELYVEEVG